MTATPREATNKKAKQRDLAVDTLRGIACLLLVTMHVVGYNERQGIHVPEDSPFRWYTESFVYLRMPLFTFLSGYVYAWRPAVAGKYRTFMGKKVRRLLIPYVIFVALIGVMQTVVPGANNPTELAVWEWFLYSLSPYWFLLSTFWLFAIIAILDSYNLLKRWDVLGVIALSLVVVNVLVRPAEQTVLQFGNALSLAPFFIVGIMASRFRWAQASRLWIAATGLAVFVAFGYSQLGLVGVVPAVDSRSNLFGIILGATFPIFMLMLGAKWKPLAWVGKYSSGIFLLHPFAVAGTRVVVERLGVDQLVIEFVVITIFGITFSIFGTWVLQRLKVGRVILGERP